MKQIIFFGECMIEGEQSEPLRFGGDSLNSALYLARTTNSSLIKVLYATALGDDNESEQLLTSWSSENIDTSLVVNVGGRSPGRYQIKTSANGERSFIYQRDYSAAKLYLKYAIELLKCQLQSGEIDYFYFSGISLAILSEEDRQKLFSLLSDYKKQGGQVVFDNNYRPTLWQNQDVKAQYHQALLLADIALLTDEDEYAIYGGMADIETILNRLASYSIDEIVIKQGNKPCIVKFRGCQVSVNSYAVEADQIVDTSAAGDAFAAGYLAKRLNEDSILSAVQFAHQVAARVIQYSGAIIPQKAMQDLMPQPCSQNQQNVSQKVNFS